MSTICPRSSILPVCLCSDSNGELTVYKAVTLPIASQRHSTEGTNRTFGVNGYKPYPFTTWVLPHIRISRIELLFPAYQTGFLTIGIYPKPVEVVETSFTAWKAVVIAVTLYGHLRWRKCLVSFTSLLLSRFSIKGVGSSRTWTEHFNLERVVT